MTTDEQINASHLRDYRLVAYALRPDIDQPYGYIVKGPTLEDPRPFPEPVLIEGGCMDQNTGMIMALIKRVDPVGLREDTGDQILKGDPEKIWAVDYDLDIDPDEIGMKVGAEAYANGTGAACYPIDFERRISYRYFAENGGSLVTPQWLNFYEAYIYENAPFPGLLLVEGGTQDVKQVQEED